ncbi:unnamed protein product [Alternaria alternata]
MPPKKKIADEGAEAGGDGKFSWTADNERTLLLLTMGRTITSDDHHKLVEALPPGTNWNAIRQRFGKMRKEQRARMEELGWTLPDGATETPTKTPTKSPKKRTVATEKSDEGGDAEAESPTKKPRARKPKETAKKEIKVEDMADGGEMEDEGV